MGTVHMEGGLQGLAELTGEVRRGRDLPPDSVISESTISG